MTLKRIRLIYSILLSISIVAAGACLIAACLSIYSAGDHPFSRESVALAFSSIAIPVYLCLALVIISFIMDFIYPAEQKKPTAKAHPAQILQRLYDTLDLSDCDKAYRNNLQRHRNKREVHVSISIGLLVLGGAIFLGYVLSDDSFHTTNITSSVVRAMWILLPCVLIPFFYAVFASYYSKLSISKEIDLAKQWETHGGRKHTVNAKCPAASSIVVRSTTIVRYTVLVVALAILIYGFLTGGTADVLTKAVNICTECVGLG